MLTIPSRVIAASFALTSFAAATLAGLYAGNAASTILWRATLVMIACWLIGLLVGSVAQRAVESHIERYKQANPIPEPEAQTQEAEAEGQNQDAQPAGQAQPASSS